MVFFFVCTIKFAYSQNIDLPSARSMGLAFTSTTIGDEWSLFNNVGGLANNDELEFLLSYQNKYSSLGLAKGAVGVVFPFKKTYLGSGVSFLGDHLLMRTNATIAVAHQVGFGQAGLRLRYLQYSLQNRRAIGALIIDIGGIFKLSEQINLGIQLRNLNQANLNVDIPEPLPTEISIGIAYTPISEVSIRMQAEKQVDQAISMAVAFEYLPIKYLALRTGIRTNPSVGFLGVGLIWPRFKLDIACAFDQKLGLSYETSMSIRLSKK